MNPPDRTVSTEERLTRLEADVRFLAQYLLTPAAARNDADHARVRLIAAPAATR